MNSITICDYTLSFPEGTKDIDVLQAKLDTFIVTGTMLDYAIKKHYRNDYAFVQIELDNGLMIMKKMAIYFETRRGEVNHISIYYRNGWKDEMDVRWGIESMENILDSIDKLMKCI